MQLINAFIFQPLVLILIIAVFPAVTPAQPKPGPKNTQATAPLVSDVELMQQYGSDIHKAVPALLESLKSSQASIRRNAAFALGELGPDAAPAVDALAHALRNDTDIEVRRNAAFALGEIGTAALPVLLKSLNDKNSRVRRNVASALVRIGPPAIPALIPMLDAPNPIIRKNAAGILGRIGPKAKTAVPALEKHLDDPDKSFCWTVKQALRNIKQVTVAGLIESLNDKDPLVRTNAARQLGKKGLSARPAIPVLIQCLQDEKAAVRQQASFALAAIGEPAVLALISALGNDIAQVRKNAAFSLGEMGSTALQALPALKNLLTDRNTAVRWCADNAIKKITTTGAEKDSDNQSGTDS